MRRTRRPCPVGVGADAPSPGQLLHQPQPPPTLSLTVEDPQRAVTARRHEVETLERSVAHHEQAAELQDRHGRPERAAEARARAAHDRELLAQARAELAEDEAAAQEASSWPRPPPGDAAGWTARESLGSRLSP